MHTTCTPHAHHNPCNHVQTPPQRTQSPPPQVRNEKARRFLMNMRKKPGVSFDSYFPKADKGALSLLRRLLAFDPAERPTAEEALSDPYFAGLSQPSREPTREAVSKLAFEFERRKLTVDEVRELIYREILEYHPQVLADYLAGPRAQPNFYYPSAIDKFKRQFADLESGGAAANGRNGLGQATSLPRERVRDFQQEASKYAGGPPPAGVAAHAGAGVVAGGPGCRPGLPPATSAVNELGYSVKNMTVDGRHAMTASEYANQQLLRSNSYK